nr:Coenzyme F420 hydrogenase/dehydrogenase, beta subunit C-terminal domain [uncultured Methanobacterium sp.]
MKKTFNVEKTKELDLCISCEMCYAVCPEKAIKIHFQKGQFLPEVDQKCTFCGKCMLICPGIDIDPFNLRNEPNITETSFDTVGKCLNVYTTYSKNSKIRDNSSSGGIATDLITDLIESQEYDSAFVLPFDTVDYEPVRLEELNDKKDIFKSAKSKYIPASAYNIIKTLQKKGNENKRYIIVATPCILQGILNFLKIKNISRDNLLFIGLFCDKTMNYNIIRYYEDDYKDKKEKISKFEFRTKENHGWPGNSKIYFDSNRELMVDKKIRKQLKKYYQLNRCLFCLNGKLNPLADISLGDCYLTEERDNAGKSNVIIRTKKGKEAFDNHSELFNIKNAQYLRIVDSQGLEKKRDTLNYVKLFLGNNQIYPDFESEKFPQNLKTELSKKQKYIKWGENHQINWIKMSILIDKYWKYFILRFKLLSVGFVIVLNFLKDQLHSLFGKRKVKDSGENIIIIGGGLYNKGAQAMTFTTVNELKEKYPDKNIFLFSEPDFNRNPHEKEVYNFNIVPWNPEIKTIILGLPQKLNLNVLNVRSNRETVDLLKEIIDETDLFVDISGYRLSSFGAITSLDYILDIMIAKKYSARYYILPQSIGPFDYPLKFKFFLLPLMRFYLKFPKKIFPRETEGVESLKSLNLTNFTKSSDLVLNRKEDYDLNNIYTRQVPIRKIHIEPNAVGIIPNINVLKTMNSDSFYSMYKLLIDLSLDEGKQIYILRHSYEDLELCENIKLLFNDNEKIKLIRDDFSSIELEYIVEQFEAVVASRYHSIIHCYRNYVPVLAIGWATKYYELLNNFHQLDYFMDARNGVSHEELKNKMKDLLKNYEKEKSIIKKEINSLKLDIFNFVE